MILTRIQTVAISFMCFGVGLYGIVHALSEARSVYHQEMSLFQSQVAGGMVSFTCRVIDGPIITTVPVPVKIKKIHPPKSSDFPPEYDLEDREDGYRPRTLILFFACKEYHFIEEDDVIPSGIPAKYTPASKDAGGFL